MLVDFRICVNYFKFRVETHSAKYFYSNIYGNRYRECTSYHGHSFTECFPIETISGKIEINVNYMIKSFDLVFFQSVSELFEMLSSKTEYLLFHHPIVCYHMCNHISGCV